MRMRNAEILDKYLVDLPEITVPERSADKTAVYHIYCLRAQRRDELVEFLLSQGIDAKIHYPIPMHLQPAAKQWGYKVGDFPVAEEVCSTVFSLPVHEFIREEELAYTAHKVREFYGK